MRSQIFLCIVCHTIILDEAKVVAMVRVRTAVIAFPMSSSGERVPGLVAIAETAEDSSAVVLSCSNLSSTLVRTVREASVNLIQSSQRQWLVLSEEGSLGKKDGS